MTLNNLPVGNYTIGTTYSGDANYAPSTGNNVAFTVTQATASLSTNLSATSFTTGSTSTLTVTVTLPGTAVVPTGSTFIATIVGVTGCDVHRELHRERRRKHRHWRRSSSPPAPIAGTYTLQVVCGANANFTCTPNSLSISSTATGGATGTTVTTTTLAISPITPAIGQTVTFTATVSTSATAIAANPIAGIVNFYDGTTQIATGTIAPVTVAGVTTYVATATYTFTGTTTAHTAHRNLHCRNTDLRVQHLDLVHLPSRLRRSGCNDHAFCEWNQHHSGRQRRADAATVTGATTTTDAPRPTGTVSFYILGSHEGGNPHRHRNCSGPPATESASGDSRRPRPLPSGNLSIYATYNGDANFSSAISNTITLGLSRLRPGVRPADYDAHCSRPDRHRATGVVTLIDAFPGTVRLSVALHPQRMVRRSPAASTRR